MPFVRYFVCIVAAALASALLGAGFACLVAAVSPEFVRGLFHPEPGDVVRFAAAVGMIWGVFLGALTMAFCLFLATVHYVVDVVRKRNTPEQPSGG
jgi:hypothetical protein